MDVKKKRYIMESVRIIVLDAEKNVKWRAVQQVLSQKGYVSSMEEEEDVKFRLVAKERKKVDYVKVSIVRKTVGYNP